MNDPERRPTAADVPEAWFGLGRLAFASQDWPACVGLMERGFALADAATAPWIDTESLLSAHVHYNFALNALGRVRDALTSVERGLALAPDHAMLVQNRAAYRRHLGLPRVDGTDPSVLEREFAFREAGRATGALRLTVGVLAQDLSLHRRHLGHSLSFQGDVAFEEIVVDNAGNGVFRSWAAFANHTLDRAACDLVLLAHADLELAPGALARMLAFAASTTGWGAIGVVGSEDGGTIRWSHSGPARVATLDACLILVDRGHGLRFDEECFDGFHGAVEDYCLRAADRGLAVWVAGPFGAAHVSATAGWGHGAWVDDYWRYLRRLGAKRGGNPFWTTSGRWPPLSPIEALAADLYRSLAPNQKPSEYAWIAGRVSELLGHPRAVLEIGSERGGTLGLWSALGTDEATLVCVDLPSPSASAAETAAAALSARVRPSQRFALIAADSRLASTRDEVSALAPTGGFDLCFIDADHAEASVRRDFELYAPLVRDGGLVAFHDILGHPAAPDIEVHRLWRELRQRFPAETEERIEDERQVCMGIGLLHMTAAVRDSLAPSSMVDRHDAGSFTVAVVQPPGFLPSEAFRELAEAVQYGLARLGLRAQTVWGTAFPQGQRTIVLGWHLDPGGIELPAGSVLYNVEQLSPDAVWMTPAALDRLRRHPVWDMSATNVRALAALGIPARHVPVGYVPELSRLQVVEEEFDVVFFGSSNERRDRVLRQLERRGATVRSLYGVYGAARDELVARARIALNVHFYEARLFEAVRIGYLLANRRFVVCETTSEAEEEDRYADGVVFAEYDRLVETCLEWLARPAADRRRVADVGFARFSARPMEVVLDEALTATWGLTPATASAPRPGTRRYSPPAG